MLAPIPRLENYDISPVNGFLPDELPLDVLPDPYYKPWESIVRNLQGLILGRRLRGVVNGMRILSTDYLKSEAEWRRAYSLLAFLSHAYIWGGDGPAEVSNLFASCHRLATHISRLYLHPSQHHSYLPVTTLTFHPSPPTLALLYGTSSLSSMTSLSTTLRISQH